MGKTIKQERSKGWSRVIQHDLTAKLDIPLERKRANLPEKIVCCCGATDQDDARASLPKQEAAEYAL